MVQSGPNKAPANEDTNSTPSRTLDEHFNALFSTVVGLPSAIYNRGNEHGRVWNRRFHGDENAYEKPFPQEQEDSGYPRKSSKASTTNSVQETSTDVDDWVSGIIKELVRGEEQAKDMYEWWAKMDRQDEPKVDEHNRGSRNSGRVTEREAGAEEEARKKAIDPHGKGSHEWAQIFPAWQKSTQNEERSIEGCRRYPTRGVDDTVEKLHHDLERWFGDAEKWTRQVQRGFERDARLWEDEGLFGPSMPFSKPLSTLFSLGVRPFLPHESAVGYLLYSEYSPLHLEHEDGFDASWRTRFEDLLRAQDGKKMIGADVAEQIPPSSGVDWLSRIMPLLKEGEKPGRITIGSTSTNQPVVQVEEVPSPTQPSPQAEQAGDGPVTELDLYERHFGQIPHSKAEQPASSRPMAQDSESYTKQPSIWSTLTTTERHVALDGSVTTKTVLKKRFADGREESSETVETTPGTTAAFRPPSNLQQSRMEKEVTQEVDHPKRRGWFWSS